MLIELVEMCEEWTPILLILLLTLVILTLMLFIFMLMLDMFLLMLDILKEIP